ncbi:alginate lyase family protein [Chitinophaga filiformis]|uniref:Alginate lyase n=1 Tax=Chitinophaga filiformis TaxID=104663 RepID=A0A1G7NVA4_CHIFI|nr:alginate lyase family protein [Chitinophaga filiformis]SDF77954.1 Alginate lyase [Chitinophaga filiformis]
MKTNVLMLLGTLGLLLAASCKKDKSVAYTAPLELKDHDTAFVHPGLLHTDADFTRMKTKVAASAEPWLSGWNRLTSNAHASLTYVANPVPIVYRGYDGVNAENYSSLFNDIAAAYADALRWKVSGDEAYAKKSIAIMNAWSSTLKRISGTNDSVLCAGLQGYQFANAGEIMRSYKGWSASDFARFQHMMLDIFYPINHAFLTRRERCMSHFYANWDLCNMCSVTAIGVLCDDRSIYNEGIQYFRDGAGNGNIKNAVYYIHEGGLGQWQESGRDQGHTVLGIGLMGAFCEMTWNQGDDMYGYDDNRFLKGAEYVAKYNLMEDVPYTAYTNCLGVNQTVIGDGSRGNIRPVWELVYNHYVKRKGLSAPYTERFAAKVRPEGGGGSYGNTSGGFDQLGYGTLTCTIGN